jgi:hypothetical protein
MALPGRNSETKTTGGTIMGGLAAIEAPAFASQTHSGGSWPLPPYTGPSLTAAFVMSAVPFAPVIDALGMIVRRVVSAGEK